MKVSIKKEKLLIIKSSFKVLKETPDNKSAVTTIEECLSDIFNVTFHVEIVDTDASGSFIMSVFPEKSTIDKIVDIATSNKNEMQAIQSLFEKTKDWYIEIDKKILINQVLNFSADELTALVLHEIGHIACSNSVSSRLLTIIQYEYAKCNIKEKLVLKDKMFKSIMSIPVLNGFMMNANKDTVKNEIKADKYAVQFGYKNELTSALQKLISTNSITMKSLPDGINQGMKLSSNIIQQLTDRNNVLLKESVDNLKSVYRGSMERDCINDIESSLYSKNFRRSVIFESMDEFRNKRFDDVTSETAVYEFFSFGSKQLKRIDPAELDYIEVRIPGIMNENDKMLLISYLYNKLDIVEYYISILENPALASKYTCPHSLSQLYAMKNRLESLRNAILSFHIPEKNKNLLVAYPDGYEG